MNDKCTKVFAILSDITKNGYKAAETRIKLIS